MRCEEARERVVAWIDEAISDGARLVTGGKLEGACLQPTVLADVPAAARVVCEEVFWPVLSLRTVKSVQEGIEGVNSARYDLNTAIFTSDLAAALTFARETGSVLVNITPSFRADHMPCGGVKDSGQGRDGVKYAIAELLDERLVVLAPIRRAMTGPSTSQTRSRAEVSQTPREDSGSARALLGSSSSNAPAPVYHPPRQHRHQRTDDGPSADDKWNEFPHPGHPAPRPGLRPATGTPVRPARTSRPIHGRLRLGDVGVC